MQNLLDVLSTADITQFLLFAFLLSLLVRVISVLLRATELASASKDNKFFELLWKSFLGFGDDPTKYDYWHPFILGWLEFTIYPVLMVTGTWTVIGAWLGFKTLAQWKHWSEHRPAFNRFLICNVLVVVLSLLLMAKLVKVQ